MLIFLDLPEEIILKIFVFLDFKSRVKASFVSKNFDKYIHDLVAKQFQTDEKQKDNIPTRQEIIDVLIQYLKKNNQPPQSESVIYSRYLPDYKPSRITQFFSNFSWMQTAHHYRRQKTYDLLKWLPHVHNSSSALRLLYKAIRGDETLEKKFFPLLMQRVKIKETDLEEKEKQILEKKLEFLSKGNSAGVAVNPDLEEVKREASAEVIRKTLLKHRMI